MSKDEQSKDKKINHTLNSVAQLAKEQQELMSKLALNTNTKDIFKTAEQIRKTFKNPALKDAFKTAELYSKSFKTLENSLATHNLDTLQKFLKNAIPSNLKKDYQLAFKATEQLKQTEEQLKSLGILKDKSEELKKLTQTTGFKSALDYANEVAKQAASLSTKSFLSQIQEQEKQFKNTHKETSRQNTFTYEPDIKTSLELNNEIFKIQQKKAAEREKREKAIYENSEIQVKQLISITKFMENQSKHLSLQNEILTEQVKNLKQQNTILERQQEDNRKSSKLAFWVAIISIAIGIIVGIGQIYFSYLIYKWEDKSDNKNHVELLQAIKNSGKNKELPPLIEKQIQTSQKTNKLLEKFLEQQIKSTNKKNLTQQEIKQ